MKATATAAASVGVKKPDRMPPSRITGVIIGPMTRMDACAEPLPGEIHLDETGPARVQKKM